ncbi:triacylglycerol lipase, partial [Dictyocaulus viviparus]
FRKDLGKRGSFGGKESETDDIKHDPVIFVHGVSDIAGNKMKALAELYKESGYTEAELYSTTYASGSKKNPLQWTMYSMRCNYVKQIRALILAVRFYTRRNVDVVAFSLGVPIARKAILGAKNIVKKSTFNIKNLLGTCVETEENLGGSLSHYIDTFVGISGPNHGMVFKVAGLPLATCALGILPICDHVIGLYSGLCPLESEFLDDINRKYHYEGNRVYSIYSHADEKIGYKVCNKVRNNLQSNNCIFSLLLTKPSLVTSFIEGEDGHKSFRNLLHDDTLRTTHELQISMIQGRFESVNSDVIPKKHNIEALRYKQLNNITSSGTTTSTPVDPEKIQFTELSVSDKELSDAIIDKTSIVEPQEQNIHSIRRFFRERENEPRDQVLPISSNVPQHLTETSSFYQNTSEIHDTTDTNVAEEGGYHTRISFELQ